LENLKRAGDYIAAQFRAARGQVSLQEFDVEESHYANVVASFGPDSGPVVVIGAHYDSYGNAGEQMLHGGNPVSQGGNPGADDNASGVAGLIELAVLLGKNPPGKSIELVAYTREEPPYFRSENMGSAQHARALAACKREVSYMLCLEMIGYFSDQASSQKYPVPGMGLIYPDKGNFIAVVGRFGDFSLTRRVKAAMTAATDLPVSSINAPGFVSGVDFSDHASYWNEGIPALMITDTSFYRNPNYHNAGDTPDTLDYVRMAKVVQAIYAATRE
jgi:Zn-dependent M28 family amino/carboxypeptidase